MLFSPFSPQKVIIIHWEKRRVGVLPFPNFLPKHFFMIAEWIKVKARASLDFGHPWTKYTAAKRYLVEKCWHSSLQLQIWLWSFISLHLWRVSDKTLSTVTLKIALLTWHISCSAELWRIDFSLSPYLICTTATIFTLRIAFFLTTTSAARGIALVTETSFPQSI